MLIDTPQTLAAMVIGICALMGMFALSIFRSSAKSLSTFDRLTLTSEVVTEPTPSATAEPALLMPSTADDAVLHADVESTSRSAGNAKDLRMTSPSVRPSKRFESNMVSGRFPALDDRA